LPFYSSDVDYFLFFCLLFFVTNTKSILNFFSLALEK